MRDGRVRSVGRWVVSVGLAVVAFANSGSGFDMGIHGDITRDALSFLKEDILKTISAANQDRDFDVTSTIHFDNCCFSGSVAEINRLYKEVVLPAVRNKDWVGAAKGFGDLLHTVQDFYAHSNWVDLRLTWLVDRRFDYWASLEPYTRPPSVEGGIVVVEGPLPQGWALDPGRIPELTDPWGLTRLGLVTGVWTGKDVVAWAAKVVGIVQNEPTLRCPEGCVHHAELHKDRESRRCYDQARELAVRQTRHEYCRLEALVEKRLGKDHLEALRKAWLKDPGRSPCGCLPTVRAQGEKSPRTPLSGVRIALAALGVPEADFTIAEATPFTASAFLSDDKVRIEAPWRWTAPDGQQWMFSHWELKYRDAFGFLIIIARSGDNPWTASLECRPGLTLDAIYVPVVEDAPPYTPPPPGEEPPGGGGLG